MSAGTDGGSTLPGGEPGDPSSVVEGNKVPHGLFITRQIVEAHGGAIRLEGESGAGTTFVVELPRGGAPGAGETA